MWKGGMGNFGRHHWTRDKSLRLPSQNHLCWASPSHPVPKPSTGPQPKTNRAQKPLFSHLIKGKERKPVRAKAEELAEGGERGRATGPALSVDSGGQSPRPEVPQVQASREGGRGQRGNVVGTHLFQPSPGPGTEWCWCRGGRAQWKG